MQSLPIDRTLIIAPHPDDEAIACGGLIQRLLSARATVHVALVTDGESNPWPQRWQEKTLLIGAADRARWGAMRREEALGALNALGLDTASSTTFLSFPDQGTARLLRAGDLRLRDRLIETMRRLRPTLVVSPSTFDAHADHRAICNFVHAAVRCLKEAGEPAPAIVTYVVHGECPASRLATYVELSEPERQKKLAAIERHQSQMLLSRERFVSYATGSESFYRDESDVVRVESRMRALLCGFRHAGLAVFGVPRPKTHSEDVLGEEQARHV